MKRKITLIVLVIFALSVSSLFTTVIKAESERDKLKKQLNQFQEENKKLQANMVQTTKKLTGVRTDIKTVKKEINNLDLQLTEAENKITIKQGEIDETEQTLEETENLLNEAIDRVAQRDNLLKTRVKAMYEAGEVSYLEALLDSKSIGDFLTRVDLVEKIVDSDKTILAQNIADKEEIETRKLEVEDLLTKLVADYKDLTAQRANLQAMYKQKTVWAASLEDLEEDLQKEIAAQDEAARQLAKKISDTNKELKKLEYSGGKFAWPVPDFTRITDTFGNRTHPITKKKSFHSGVDIAAPQGSSILAGADGEVVLAEYYGAYGNTIMIDHGGIITMYGHIKNGGIKVKVGQQVKRGQKIAEVGSTGLSTGPHLHFSVIKNGEYVQPMDYLIAK